MKMENKIMCWDNLFRTVFGESPRKKKLSPERGQPFLLWFVAGKSVFQQDVHDFAGSLCYAGTGAEHGSHTGLIEEVVVLSGNYTAGNDHDVLATQFLQLFDELGNEGLVASSQRAGTHYVYVVLNSLASGLFGSLEQGSHVHVESAVGISGSYHLCTAVVTVLAHLGHHDTWTAAFLLGKFLGELAGLLKVCIVLAF